MLLLLLLFPFPEKRHLLAYKEEAEEAEEEVVDAVVCRIACVNALRNAIFVFKSVCCALNALSFCDDEISGPRTHKGGKIIKYE